MNLQTRLSLLLPDAREASRESVLWDLVRPLLPVIWGELPQDEPIPLCCALAERELLRRVPLAMSPGELLAGRLDRHAPPTEQSPSCIPPPFPGGQTAHTALDACKLLEVGTRGVRAEIEDRLRATASDDSRVFYQSALISLEGFEDLAARLRSMALELSLSADHPEVRSEMADLARVLERVPHEPARSFYEALQAMHLLFLAASLTVQSLYGPGRLDRVLWPYYTADLAAGRITREHALELICCQFIQMNYLFPLPLPVIVGGLGADGRDTTNELTYLCLEADRAAGLLNPSLALGVNDQTPRDLLDAAVESVLAGRTKPSFFNDRVIISGLESRGVSRDDAVDYIHSTCVEITLIGRSNIFVASPYINLLKPLEFVLNGGRQIAGDENLADVNAHTHTAPAGISEITSFEQLLSEYERQLSGRIADAALEMREIRKRRMEGWAYPLVSCFTADCIERGIDMDRGGARYTWTETSNVGLANVTDSLMVLKRRVFEEKSHTLEGIRDALIADFPDEHARLSLIKGVPRYGNDNPEADAIAARLARFIYDEHAKHRDYSGGPFVPGFFCWIMHRILGAQTGASPDGRRAGEVLADAAGSAQGRDTSGPTAAINSITSWPHEPGLGGIVLNLRFSPSMLSSPRDRSHLIDLLWTYIRLGGFEMQVNAVDTATLREAQLRPEDYTDLLVRVAGYSDHFTRLDRAMQEEVISRTEHGPQ